MANDELHLSFLDQIFHISQTASASTLAPTFGWLCICLILVKIKGFTWTQYWRTKSAKARALWAVRIFETENFMLSYFTLRNAIMATTYMSRTAVGVLSLIATLAYRQTCWTSALAFKYCCALVLLSSSAFSFLQTTLVLSNIGFLFPVAADSRNPNVTKKTVAFMMVLAQKFWWLGLRLFYVSFPVIIWIVIGPFSMLFVSLALLYALIYSDKNLPFAPNILQEIGLREELVSSKEKCEEIDFCI